MSDNVKEIIGSIFSTTIKIVIGLIVIMFIRKYAVMAYDYGYRVFTEPPVTINGDGTAVTVSVGEDVSVMDIGNMLENKGLVRDGRLFFIQELVSGHHGEMTPGKYELTTAMTADDMIAIMSGSESADQEEDLLYNEDEKTAPFEVDNADIVDEASAEEAVTEGEEDGESDADGEGAE